MKMIVGLGNPGGKYEATRHNIGFVLLDALASEYGNHWRSKFQAEEQKISVGGEDIILLKPQTFMNLSGQSVAAAAGFYKIPSSQILVIHDELDLAPGRVKLKKGGGHAGHNGLRSLIEHIGADFERMRVGIGHPGEKSKVSNYVLHNFSKSDQLWIGQLQDRFPKALPYYLQGKQSQFMEMLLTKDQAGNKVNRNTNHSQTRSDADQNPSAKSTSASPFDQLKSLFKRD